MEKKEARCGMPHAGSLMPVALGVKSISVKTKRASNISQLETLFFTDISFEKLYHVSFRRHLGHRTELHWLHLLRQVETDVIFIDVFTEYTRLFSLSSSKRAIVSNCDRFYELPVIRLMRGLPQVVITL